MSPSGPCDSGTAAGSGPANPKTTSTDRSTGGRTTNGWTDGWTDRRMHKRHACTAHAAPAHVSAVCHAHTSACTQAPVHANLHTCTHARMHARLLARSHSHAHISMRTQTLDTHQTCIHACINAWIQRMHDEHTHTSPHTASFYVGHALFFLLNGDLCPWAFSTGQPPIETFCIWLYILYIWSRLEFRAAGRC